MKIKFQYIGLLALLISVASCKKDNFEAPSSILKGKIQYMGEAIQVEYDRVPFELYQFGFGKVGAIRQSFAPDGSYSCVLFDGEYKLIIPSGQGPFKWNQTIPGSPDSLLITVKGNQTLDLNVTPYYMVRTPQFSVASGKVNGSFKAEKIVVDATGKNIESVSLYINKTQFVSSADNIASTTISGGSIADPNNISMQVTIPTIVPTQNYVFARVGIKIAGVEDRIFSPVQKLTL